MTVPAKMGNVLRYIARKSHEYDITDNDSLTFNRIMTAVLHLKVDRGHPVRLLFSTSYTRLEYDF